MIFGKALPKPRDECRAEQALERSDARINNLHKQASVSQEARYGPHGLMNLKTVGRGRFIDDQITHLICQGSL